MWKYRYIPVCEAIYLGYRFKSDDVPFVQKVWKIDHIGYANECKYSDKVFLCDSDINYPKGTYLIVRRYRSYEIGISCEGCIYNVEV